MENDYYKRYEPFFGSWYIKRFIGKGSYGKVFEVERKDAFGTVYTGALKAITVPTSEDELEDLLANGMDRDSASTYFRNYAEGLNREIALMSRLKGHSNIVSYEDHDIRPHEDGMGWDMLIRMELLTPITIFQKANKPFTRRQVIQLGIDLCRALEVCQKYNIIHRDIKPANIFLSETGDFKLGDFGVARIASAATGASTRAGTVNYMAPEVFRGEKYTSNVDIYSLGLVMYQLLNANRMPLCPPYPQLMTPEQWEQANARRLSGTVLPPPANADGRLAEIVLKACLPNSAERYEAPSLMRQALEAILYTEQETKDIYPKGDALPLPKTSEKNPPVPQPGTDRETENVWVKMREAGGESALAEPLPVTETLTEKVPTKHELESECEKVPETAPDETENKTQYLFKAQEEARRKAEEARRAAEEAARQTEFERREQELTRKREETRQRAKANVEAKREAEENASKVEVPVRPSKKKPARGLKHVWIDVVGAVGIGAVLLIMGYNFFLGGMFTKKEEPASSEEGSAAASASSKADSAVVVELPAAASMSESESASSEEPASTSIPESSSVSSSSAAVSSSSTTSSLSTAVASSTTKEVSSSESPNGSARAANITDSGSCGANAIWELDGSDYTLSIKGSGKMSDWKWIQQWSRYDRPWDYYARSIPKVEISDGITSIGANAFWNCHQLTSVTIPNSVTDIGEKAFADDIALSSIKIPNGVTNIDKWAFQGCTSLTSVVLPSSVTNIGWAAFNYCTSLTSVTFSSGITSIGGAAFKSCVSLKSVEIPDSVTSIGNEAFDECTSLASVTISRNCTVAADAFPSTTQINYYD